MSSFVFIAAPFGPDPNSTVLVNDQIRLNVARACALGRLAIAMDFVPEVPHVSVGALFAYADTDPTAREKSLKLGLSRLSLFMRGANADLGLWVLTRDDGTVSSGCAAELAEAKRQMAYQSIWQTSWQAAKDIFHVYGLDDIWENPLLALPEMLPAAALPVAEARPRRFYFKGGPGDPLYDAAVREVEERLMGATAS